MASCEQKFEVSSSGRFNYVKDLEEAYLKSVFKKDLKYSHQLYTAWKEAEADESYYPPLIIDIISKLDKWKQNLCNEDNKKFFQRVCKTDGEIMAVQKLNGDIKLQKPILHTCHSSYCSDEDCYKQKYLIGSMIFASYFYSRPQYIAREDNFCFHFTTGDKRQTLYTKKEIQNFRARCISFFGEVNKKVPIVKNFQEVLNKFYDDNKTLKKDDKKSYNKLLNALRKKLFLNLKCVGSPDNSFNSEFKGEELYQHIHWASMRPYYFDKEQLLQIKEIADKHNIVFHKIGNRKAVNLIDYFAKRRAGRFGHKETGYYGYKDIMTPEYYYENYSGLKGVLTFGFTRDEKNYIKRHSKEILKAVAQEQTGNKRRLVKTSVLSCIYSMFEIHICPKCSSKDWILQEIINQQDKPPPDISQTLEIEIIRMY
jgi:hypothetical protein